MDREAELEIVRRAYAKRLMFVAGVHDRRVDAAFASVRRERFLGRGPWPILRWDRGYVPTPSRNPVYIYDDVLIGIVPERHLNNGQPSLHALLITSAGARPGEHAVHVGAGVGYYTAILAHLVGRRGRVTAIEYDPALAAKLAVNFKGEQNIGCIHGDGTRVEVDIADVIYINAGATRPGDIWLDRLADGGRLILPLTSNKGFRGSASGPIERHGAVFRIERRGEEFLATRVSGVAIFPCEGGRDEGSAAALEAAFEKGGSERVTRLYRRDDLPEERCLAARSRLVPDLRLNRAGRTPTLCAPFSGVTVSASGATRSGRRVVVGVPVADRAIVEVTALGSIPAAGKRKRADRDLQRQRHQRTPRQSA